MRRRRRALVVAALLTLGAAATAGALTVPAGSVQASSGTVSATFSWKQGSADTGGGFTAPHLMISRAGVVALDRDLTQKADLGGQICPAGCLLGGGTAAKPKPLRVVDLDGDGEPEVLIDYYTDGAHCCLGTDFFSYDAASNAYTSKLVTWGDDGVKLKDVDGDGKIELIGINDGFAYTFTDFADSYLPIEINDFVAGKLVTVTGHYPTLVKADAARILKYVHAAHKDKGDELGLVAAYVYDLDTIGQRTTASKFLDSEIKHGYVGSAKAAAKYKKSVTKFLKEIGTI